MREKERRLARMRLDEELRPFRTAGREKNPTNELLRAVRQALKIPVEEIAGKMGVSRSVIFRLEKGERENAIRMKSMSRMATAMGCKLVYGIVPEDGRTLQGLTEMRLWESVLGKGRD
jgi:transcriptional regulator with XRE-family HTH domain